MDNCLHNENNPAATKYEGRIYFCECALVSLKSRLQIAVDALESIGQIADRSGRVKSIEDIVAIAIPKIREPK